MPIVRFQIESEAPSDVVLERLRAAVGPKPDFLESLEPIWKRKIVNEPPFVGSVMNDSFRIHRGFRGRNSFVPLIWGRVVSVHDGTRMSGIMFLHPAVAVFAAFWLGVAGYSVVTDKAATIGSSIMFIFGVSLIGGSFLVEVSRAKRILRTVLLCDSQVKNDLSSEILYKQ